MREVVIYFVSKRARMDRPTTMRANQPLRLFIVLLGVCCVIFWSHNTFTEPVADNYLQDNGREDVNRYNKVEIEEGKEMRQNLDLCNAMYTEYNATSHQYKILKKRLHMIQEYIPEKYSDEFRNPCWYDFHPNLTRLRMHASWCGDPLQCVQSIHDFGPFKIFHEKCLYCLPAFFISGFPKSASTTLYEMIIQHPLVAQNKCKEHQFWNRFIREDLEKEIHPLWYLNRFSQSAKLIESSPLGITVDASPVYTHSSIEDSCVIPTLLKRVLPEARFILIMRNPSERYFSHFWFKQKEIANGKGNRAKLMKYVHTAKAMEDFHKCTVDAIAQFQSCVDGGNPVLYCIIHESKSYVSDILYYSLYYYHIVPWLKIFPYERFLFIRTEDLINDPSVTMSKVWHFLKLDDFPTEIMFENVNTMIKDVKVLRKTKEMLDEFYRPYNQLLATLLSDESYLWNS